MSDSQEQTVQPYDLTGLTCTIQPKDIIAEKTAKYSGLSKDLRRKMYNDMREDAAKGKPWRATTNVALIDVMKEKGELEGDLVRQ
jgi:hypothetical protein